MSATRTRRFLCICLGILVFCYRFPLYTIACTLFMLSYTVLRFGWSESDTLGILYLWETDH